MIILGLLLLCVILVLVGTLVQGGVRVLDFFVFPAGRRGERVPAWLVLLLVATCLGVAVFLQHGLFKHY